jgi:NAD(P)-dependent dehydrogenase (short-subunit alcohol dehydrogenase family)
MQNPLAGRTALITGAGNGLGRAIALKYASAGARIIAVGRDTVKIDETVKFCGSNSRALSCDVSSDQQVQNMRDLLVGEEISILINNAAIPGPVKPITEISVDEWDEVFSVNVRSVYLMSHYFLPQMIKAGKGDVINIASSSGKRPLVRRTPYAASKMAIIGITRSLSFEVGPYGVAVNSLSPGAVRGPRMDRNFRLESEISGVSVAEAQKVFTSKMALGRLVEEQEIADAAFAMLFMPGLCGADIDLSAGMVAPA